ncbi:MAG: hypothetical protein HY905_03910 [Deltaproteobacteria bacterium]|nr:hypothetical protein [Deltaproteobacteria bacterium]
MAKKNEKKTRRKSPKQQDLGEDGRGSTSPDKDMMKRLLEFSSSYSAELSSKMRRLDEIIGDRHWASVGSYKEELIRQHLRGHLPRRFEVGTGFVIARLDENRLLSRQIDILVWDSQAHMPLYRDGAFAIVLPEACKAAIEVKSTLDSDTLRDALSNLDSLTSFRRLDGFLRSSTSIYRAVFAFKADDDVRFPDSVWRSCWTYWHEQQEWPLDERIASSEDNWDGRGWEFPWINAIGVLGRGLVNLQRPTINDKDWITYPAYRSCDGEGDDTYGALERDLLLHILGEPQHSVPFLLDHPGAASILFGRQPAFFGGSTFMMIPEPPAPITRIGQMDEKDAAELAARRFQPQAPTPRTYAQQPSPTPTRMQPAPDATPSARPADRDGPRDAPAAVGHPRKPQERPAPRSSSSGPGRAPKRVR